MRNKLFQYACGLIIIACSLQMQAQNKVAAPMKDVNQVIDNTLDSLNKARQDRKRVRAAKEITLYCFWWETPPCVPEP